MATSFDVRPARPARVLAAEDLARALDDCRRTLDALEATGAEDVLRGRTLAARLQWIAHQLDALRNPEPFA